MDISLQLTQENIKKRIASIDIVRGLVMLLMLVDHVRERFFYHQQVSDPMELDTTSPQLFFTRLSAHFCAPVFVFLSGLSAWLYAHPANKPQRSPRGFLFKRGVFIIFIEIAVINWLWMGSYETLWLQVMWAIGISMLALSLASALPYKLILAIGLLIVAGHNALSTIHFSPNEWGYTIWTILHDRGFIYTSEHFEIKASYPVLPWIGVILLGYCMGPLYSSVVASAKRKRILLLAFAGAWFTLLVLRSFNLYGETLPWSVSLDPFLTVMSFLNYTKYPPSLDFILLTLGGLFLALALLENADNAFTKAIETFGSAPMFFYIVHLLILLVGYEVLLTTLGPNQGELFAVDHVWQIWLIAIGLALLLFMPTKAFAQFKHSSRSNLIKYF
ncbi:DUF1624 domain-containing protein [Flavobacterium sp. W21_SRS_FM6]|uniref:DUF1624 domain-containing protein n=1 Tax=Flavobacterium sp. W21_SRS_FM6 TaxID=3240268 RepID=UPI003F923FEE